MVDMGGGQRHGGDQTADGGQREQRYRQRSDPPASRGVGGLAPGCVTVSVICLSVPIRVGADDADVLLALGLFRCRQSALQAHVLV